MIQEIVDNYYEAVIEGTADVTGMPRDEVIKEFNEDLGKAQARAAILISESDEDDEPHILYVDLDAFDGALSNENIAEFNKLLQEKIKG